MVRTTRLLVLTGLAVALLAAAAPDRAADEKTLQKAGVQLDGESLLNYFRLRIASDADKAKIQSLVDQLGDPSYAAREQATTELSRLGPPAVLLLRKALSVGDVEIARRAERCLTNIEKIPGGTATAAAARMLAATKPPGAAAALLAYLPWEDDSTVLDQLRQSLADVAVIDGRADPAVLQSLNDSSAVRRAAAAESLIRSKRPDVFAPVKQLMDDADGEVRLRIALALVEFARDKSAVDTVIEQLADPKLTNAQVWRAEEMLGRVAGSDGPSIVMGAEPADRKRCRDAWKEWWQKNAEKTDLTKADLSPKLLGFTLVVQLDARSQMGQVCEINGAKQVLWKIDGLQQPFDAAVSGPDRVIICEYSNGRVFEREFNGKERWSVEAHLPVGVQSLPNGHVLIVSRGQLMEIDDKQKTLWTFERNQSDILAAQKLKDGSIAYATQSGIIYRLDEHRRDKGSFDSKGALNPYSSLEVLPNGNVLVTKPLGLFEYPAEGKQHVWTQKLSNPTSAQRLPNGHTLAACTVGGSRQVVELDRQGNTVWEYKPEGGGRVWRAKRR